MGVFEPVIYIEALQHSTDPAPIYTAHARSLSPQQSYLSDEKYD